MKHRLFWIFSIIVVLTVGFLCYYIYEKNIIFAKNEKIDSRIDILASYVNQTESVLWSMKDSAKEYGMDPRVQNMVRTLNRNRPVSTVDKVRMMEYMRLIMSSKPFINNIRFIHDPEGDEYIFDALLEYVHSDVNSEWTELFNHTYNDIELIHPEIIQGDPAITRLVIRLPLNSYNKSSMMLIEINNDRLLKMAVGNDTRKVFFRYSPQNELSGYLEKGAISSAGGEQIELYYAAPAFNGYIVEEVATKNLFRSELAMKRVMWILLFVMVFCGLMISWFLAGYAVRPIQKLLEFINDSFPKKEESHHINHRDKWNQIQNTLEKMLQEHDWMSRTFERFRPMMLERFHFRLIMGQYRDINEVESHASLLNQSIGNRSFGLILVDSDVSLEEHVRLQQAFRLYVQSSLDQKPSWCNDAYLIDVNPYQSVILLYLPDELDDIQFYKKAFHFVKDLQKDMANKLDFTFSAILGKCEIRTSTVPATYQRMLDLLHYRFNMGSEVILSLNQALPLENSHELDTTYYIDFEKWSNLLNAGDEGRLEQAFEELINGLSSRSNMKLIKEKALGILYFLIQFINRHDLDRAKLGVDNDEVYEIFIKATHLETIREKLWLLITMIRNELAGKSQSMDEMWVTRIKNFIQCNLGNPDLSVAMISEEMNMSPPHVGRLFKKAMDISLLDYMNEMRIEKSKQLLVQTNKKVQEIANDCGYQTTHYFNKLFKKQTGITPSEYKRINKS